MQDSDGALASPQSAGKHSILVQDSAPTDASPAFVKDESPALSEILAQIIRPSQLSRAKALSSESGDPLDAVCTRLGLCSEKDLTDALVRIVGLPRLPMDVPPDAPAAQLLLNPLFLRHARCIPVSETEATLTVAMVDPTDWVAVKGLAFATEKSVHRLVCSATDFETLWQRLYADGKQSGAGSESEATNAGDVETLQDYASDAPVIRYVNQLVSRAIDLLASDIHIEPVAQQYRVRFRLDGVLTEVEWQTQTFGMAVVSRIKIMAQLNIAERRLAQDGRFSVSARGQKVDMRIATTPTLLGEAVVMRILDSDRVPLDVRALGFSRELEARWLQLLDRPHGIILVTGPTGSGKSTTLYAGLTRLNKPDRKLLTIEDPVEQQIAGVNQVHARPDIGFGFGAALRAFLRHDPDVIMVGEIRDLETGRTAIQAALTGHLILSTLHTNDAVSGITRLVDMGIDAYLIASTVSGILAQRLVRKICKSCEFTYADPGAVFRTADVESRGKPCQNCCGTGYKGRTIIAELLVITAEMRALIERGAGQVELRQQALADGMVSLSEDGAEKVRMGMTTDAEVARVTVES